MNVAMNKKGIESFDDVFKKGMNPIPVDQLEHAVEATDALVLDVRPAAEFALGFIPRAIHIGIAGDFAPWVGALVVDVKQPIVLVTPEGMEEETITRLSRIGFDNVVGYLQGGFAAWVKEGKETDTIHRISADQFKSEFKQGESVVFDVRKESEYSAEHVEEAYSRPLAEINLWFKSTGEVEHFYLHCAGGYRSMIAASILKSRGIHHFSEVEGGFKAIAEVGVPKTDFVCQSKLQKAD
jgi:rhodanese-related sulfurtransferase